MATKRLDLSDWIIHFIHDRLPQATATNGHDSDLPSAFDKNINPIYFHHDLRPYSCKRPEKAFDILLKIIEDGFLRASWSFRSGKPTIYGYTAAVCFTEMPLYAFTEYLTQRVGSGLVGGYAIAIKRNELFKSGGRPVIYGLSGKHSSESLSNSYNGCPRLLSEECGIGVQEQYRYVAMNLSDNRYIDWSHEREWRWTKKFTNETEYPGLPIWVENKSDAKQESFSQVFVITKKQSEVNVVLNLLKAHHDSQGNQFGDTFNINLLKNTHVTSLEEACSQQNTTLLKVENITNSILINTQPWKSPANLSSKITSIFTDAKELALDAASDYKESMQRDNNGRLISTGYGWAVVRTREANSDITHALVQLGLVKSMSGEGYFLSDLVCKKECEYLHEVAMAAALCAAEFLTKELGQEFDVWHAFD